MASLVYLKEELFGTKMAAVFSIFLLFSYNRICRALRHRRIESTYREFGFDEAGGRKVESMTVQEAWLIAEKTRGYEFPRITELGMQMALIGAYAIPEVSEILYKTKQLHDPKTVPRRYSDTAVLITEFIENPPGTPRHVAAVARMNYLHSHYPKIRNGDYLYILAMSCCLPIMWVDKVEWRKATPLERHARFLQWKHIGEEMKLKNIPNSYDEMYAFMLRYEAEHAYPTKETYEVGMATINLAGYWWPQFTKPLWRNIMYTIIREEARVALGLPTPPQWLQVLIWDIFFPLRRWYLQNLALPRWKLWRMAAEKPNEHGKYHMAYDAFEFEPWYVEPSFFNRWNLFGIVATLFGWANVGQKEFIPEGYEIESVGPQRWVGKGVKEVEKEKKRLYDHHSFFIEPETGKKCPFSA